MNVLALDPSLTCTGWATAGIYGTLEPPKNFRGALRLAWIRDAVRDMLNEAGPFDLVVIEGYAHGRTNQAHQLGELGGVLRLLLHDAGIQFTEVPPKKRAKYATGSGNGDKAAVLSAAIRRLGYTGSSFDEADALWLYAMAAGALGISGAVHMPAVNCEALADVHWPTRKAA